MKLLTTVLALCLLSTPAYAQYNNQGDVTGTNITTSAPARDFRQGERETKLQSFYLRDVKRELSARGVSDIPDADLVVLGKAYCQTIATADPKAIDAQINETSSGRPDALRIRVVFAATSYYGVHYFCDEFKVKTGWRY